MAWKAVMNLMCYNGSQMSQIRTHMDLDLGAPFHGVADWICRLDPQTGSRVWLTFQGLSHLSADVKLSHWYHTPARYLCKESGRKAMQHSLHGHGTSVPEREESLHSKPHFDRFHRTQTPFTGLRWPDFTLESRANPIFQKSSQQQHQWGLHFCLCLSIV